MPNIDAQRLIGDLKTLRGFGATGTGVVRPSLSPVDMDARRWLVELMTEAGLDAAIDGVGTVFGRSRNPGKALVIGSHTDTQPRGGWLDGAMGVIYAVEIARAFADDPAMRDLAVDCASWIDEEGTYCGMLGSRSFCGMLEADAIATSANREGHRLADAITEAGLDGRPLARLEPDRHVAYLEAHIEQGAILEDAAKRIGVVTGIVGNRGYDVTFTGQQNHAGTTPMPKRRDAGVALVDFCHRLHAAFAELAGPLTVWTVGHIALDPGAVSIISGRAEMILQCRDHDDATLDALEAKAHELVADANARGPVSVEIARRGEPVKPMPMDDGLQAHLVDAAEAALPGGWMSMPSGAGHDAQVLVGVLPSAMLFVPSIGGVSHDFAEDTAEDDIVLGCQVLCDAAAAILGERR